MEEKESWSSKKRKKNEESEFNVRYDHMKIKSPNIQYYFPKVGETSPKRRKRRFSAIVMSKRYYFGGMSTKLEKQLISEKLSGIKIMVSYCRVDI